MKVFVNTPIANDMIIKLLTDYRENGVEFKFVKKTGIKLEFEANNIEASSASDLVKSLIRSTEIGKALYFSVETV